MMTNMDLAERIITELMSSGIREFCLCAGARNSPFVFLLDQNKHIKVYNFFEERSAAFFALGRIMSTRHPVAVITTSGTAAAELLPAAIEGTYNSLPLVLITADRPKKYRWSGAPQSIEQVGLYSYYAEVCLDLDEENTHLSLRGLSWKKPIHINVCFKEPLLDDQVPDVPAPPMELRTSLPESFPRNMAEEIENFLDRGSPLVVLGSLPAKFKTVVFDFLKILNAPIYAEGLSGFRGHPELHHLMITSGEKMVAKFLDEKRCDSIIRIGGVPTLRLWRDLEDKRSDIPVLSLGFNHFTGLSRPILHYVDIPDLPMIATPKKTGIPPDLFELDKKLRGQMEELFLKYPRAETSLVFELSKHLGGKPVYLGNSLPVREWDFAADHRIHPFKVVGNRGANGIDGQVSTFMGWAFPEKENWCIVGDLTALYDLSALWITPQLKAENMKIVVINNSGGRIFERMFQKDMFLNTHNLNFKPWSEMFNWAYQRWELVPEKFDLAGRQIIELIPDNEQTQQFWDEWEILWNQFE
ncbi:MAG: 2-succinyl-5-enolpyruvyl-6-hydroxy-3-cyclohexene-1-carboxylic-acid synthase [Bdellovibrionota bacterium]